MQNIRHSNLDQEASHQTEYFDYSPRSHETNSAILQQTGSRPFPSIPFPIPYLLIIFGTGSSVGIATELQAGRSGIESRWGRDLPPVRTGPGAHPAFCKIGTESFPGVKCGRGVLLTTHPF